MVLLFGTDPDLTLTNTLCCDSTVGAYKHRTQRRKKERREMKDRMRSGFVFDVF